MSLGTSTPTQRAGRAATRRRLRKSVAGCLGVGLLTLALSSLSLPGSPAARTPAAKAFRTPIRHVVIIYQENHSFDDVLGAVCKRRLVRCNGYTGPVTFANHRRATNIVEPDIVPLLDHLPRSQTLALANRWNEITGCKHAPYYCVTHYRPRDIPNLAALANRFAVSDRSFASDETASFGAHITLAAGTMNGFSGNNPRPAPGVKPGPGWGCGSRKLTIWTASGGDPSWVPSCIPDRRGEGPFRESPVPYVPTIMERLEQRGLTWHIYQGRRNTRPVNKVWSICGYFHWCARNRFNLKHDSRTNHFVRAARHGNLPTLSLLLPLQGYSQHNRASMKIGDNYIGRMVEAVQKGPQWKSTAVFITYDDCGCFYDHVDPPGHLGIRAPMVIVSPWVRHNYTDSNRAIVPYSMLSFVQYNFRLESLSGAVDNAYNYRRSFNFKKPLLARVPMTTSHIPASERRKLATMPVDPDDPT